MVAAPLLVLALSAAPPAESDWTTRYTVSFDGPRVDVVARLTWNGGRGMRPDAVELRMADDYEDESGKGYGRFVRGFEARVPEGSAEPRDGYAAETVDADLGSYRVPVLKDGRAGFAYTVVLEHVPREALGYDETPHAFEGGTFWTGRALFVRGPDSDYELELRAPEGQHVTTSLDPVEDRPHVHRAAEWFHLRQTYYVVGTHFETALELPGDATMFVALDDPLAKEHELIVGQIRTFMEAGCELLDGRPPLRSLCFVESHSSEGGGAVVRRDGHVLVPPPPVAEQDDQWRRSLCHELFHLWNPNLVGFDSREMWYSEGFTDYLSHRLLAQTDSITGATFLRVVREWVESYLAQSEDERGLRAAGELGNKNNALIYQGGALAALCLDTSLRARHKNRRGLDDVMRALYELCGSGAGNEIPVRELERLLEKHGGRELGGFLERHVAGNEPLPLDDAFAAAGLELFAGELPVPDRESSARLIQTPGATTLGHGILVQRTSGGKLKPDDVLVRVDGQPVGTWDELGRALAGHDPGAELPAVVLRDGKPTEIELRLGGHGEELRRETRYLVRIKVARKASKNAKAVRAVLFPGL